MIVKSALDFLLGASRKGCALGAYNVFNLELAQATIAAAARQNAPVMVATEENDLKYCPPEVMSEMVMKIAASSEVPVILHLDHCRDVGLVERCLRTGYASVMFDGSRLPLAENIEKTRTVVSMARFFGVPVEGELGVIPLARDQAADDFEFRDVTDPEAAEQFAKQTGIHTLAPSVGTAHGVYVKLPKIHFAVLEEIRKRTQIPLVLHGGTGIPVEDVRRCISLGVAKVNIGTELRRTFVDKVVEGGSRPYIEAAEVLAEARSRVEDVVSRWTKVLGSASLLS